MAKGFKSGAGGGVPLNFRVIGGTSAPSNPKENDIWVNTESKITGFLFTSEVPNLYDTELTSTKELSGQYIKENGDIASNSSFAVSGYVELPRVTKYITVYHGTAGSSTMYHAFYDANKNFISSVFRENKTLTYNVPSNAHYVRLSLCTMSTPDKLTFLATVDDGSVEEGTVLISTSSSGTVKFNALKKNGLVVFPVSATHYIGTDWVNKTAKIYQEGAWIDWEKWLYNNGAWSNGTALTKGTASGSPTVTYNTNSIKVICSSSNTLQYLYFPQMENLDGWSKVVLKFKSNAVYTASNQTVDYSAGVRLVVSTNTDHNGLVAQAKQYNLSSGTDYTLELDISNLTGRYYVHLLISRGDSTTSGSVNVDILEVYLV